MAGTPVRVLGRIRIERDDGEEPVGGLVAERLLGALVVAEGQPVSTAALSEIVWPDEPDRWAGSALRMATTRLRRRLEAAGLDDPIVGGDRSYRLAVNPQQVDALHVESLIGRAREVGPSDPDQAAALLEAALAFWRGEPFGELRDEPWAAGATARLLELRHTAEEQLADLELARGREAVLVPRLRSWVEAAPLRERRWGQLALALYRTGRQAEALRAIDAVRERLRDQLGLELGPELRQLEQAILQQDGPLLVPASGRTAGSAEPAPIGREDAIWDVADLLRSGRLVTIHGLGGVGKSTVARAVVARHTDVAIAWADLGHAENRADAWLATAAASGIIGADDLDVLPDAVAQRLGQRPTLLVLDGAEEVAEEAAEITDALLTRTTDLRILVTSRQPLSAAFEVRYALDALPIGTPEAPGPAAALFASRAGFGSSQLDREAREQIVAVCTRVAGLPLAIELAAASADRSGLAVLAEATDATPASEAVRQALEWARGALDGESRRMLRLLALLPGGLSRATAAALAGREAGAALAPLLQARLVRARAGRSGTRYDLVPGVLELVAAEQPVIREPGAAPVIVEHLRDLGRAAARTGYPQDPARILELEDELPNVRRWLRRSLGTTSGLELAVAVAPALAHLGLAVEAASWVRQHTDAAPPADELLRAEATVAALALQGLMPTTAPNPDELEAASAVAAAHGSWRLWLSIRGHLAIAVALRGDAARAQEIVSDPDAGARVAEIDDPWLTAAYRSFLAVPEIVRGQFGEARRRLDGVAAQQLELGDQASALETLSMRAWLARAAGDDAGRAMDLAHAREISVGPGAATTRALVAAELAHQLWDAGDPSAIAHLELAIDDLVQTGQLQRVAAYRRDLGVWRFTTKDHVGAAANLRDALPVLLRTDRGGAGMGAARLAAVMVPTRPQEAARLAQTARALVSDAPVPALPAGETALIDRLLHDLGDDAAPLTDAEFLALVDDLAEGA